MDIYSLNELINSSKYAASRSKKCLMDLLQTGLDSNTVCKKIREASSIEKNYTANLKNREEKALGNELYNFDLIEGKAAFAVKLS